MPWGGLGGVVKESDPPAHGQHHAGLRWDCTEGSLMIGTRPCASPYRATSLLLMLGARDKFAPKELKLLRGVSAG